ncbi:hypothetical protein HPB47_002298, partial [Ixodes persulcatus]
MEAGTAAIEKISKEETLRLRDIYIGFLLGNRALTTANAASFLRATSTSPHQDLKSSSSGGHRLFPGRLQCFSTRGADSLSAGAPRETDAVPRMRQNERL